MENSLLQKTGTISDIQHNSIHDGPGIRTVVFFKGCPLTCPWCANPESQKKMRELEYVKRACILCLTCLNTCPHGALSEVDDEIEIDRTRCELCGRCVSVCPGDALKFIGKTMTVAEVMAVVEKDRLFYESSGGGVTLSGGEAFAQPEFASALLSVCKQKGLHTALDTSGYLKWDLLKEILLNTDLVLLDIKHLNAKLHLEDVGVPNDLILENAARVVELGIELIIRVPVIPGFNNNAENIVKTAEFARKIGVQEINLLPFHNLAEPKYRRLGRAYQFKDVKILADGEMNRLANLVQAYDLKVKIGS